MVTKHSLALKWQVNRHVAEAQITERLLTVKPVVKLRDGEYIFKFDNSIDISLFRNAKRDDIIQLQSNEISVQIVNLH